MLFCIKVAKAQEHDAIKQAIKTDDEVSLYRYAGLMKEAGDDEQAENLLKLARTAAKNNWSYDASVNN